MQTKMYCIIVTLLLVVAVPVGGFTATDEIAKLEASAAKGNSDDMSSLGTKYLLGFSGAPKDYAKAFYWWEKSAKTGNITGIYNLCYAYHLGIGVKPDYAKAASLCTRAANAGHIEAMHSLALMHRDGTGVPKSEAKQSAWLKKAAEKGDKLAQFWTAENYETGKGVKKDLKKAFYWYEKAASHGNLSPPDNFVKLAELYYSGTGVAKDRCRAYEWYEKAAMRNNAAGQYAMGAKYEIGECGEKSYAKAGEWYRKAAKNGSKAAQQRLDSWEKETETKIAIGGIFLGLAQDAEKRAGRTSADADQAVDPGNPSNWKTALFVRSKTEGTRSRCYYQIVADDYRFSMLWRELTCPARVYYHVPSGKCLSDYEYMDAMSKMPPGTLALPDPK